MDVESIVLVVLAIVLIGIVIFLSFHGFSIYEFTSLAEEYQKADLASVLESVMYKKRALIQYQNDINSEIVTLNNLVVENVAGDFYIRSDENNFTATLRQDQTMSSLFLFPYIMIAKSR